MKKFNKWNLIIICILLIFIVTVNISARRRTTSTSTPTPGTVATNTPTQPAAQTNTPAPTTPPASNSNLALNRPATSSSDENSSYTANLAVDGNTGTRWSSAFSDPQWIQVDLGATYSVASVVLRWEAAYGSAYQIQISANASSWTTLYSTSSSTGGVQTLTVNGSGRYIRMYGTARGTEWGYSLYEFEVYGAAGGPTPPTSATATPVAQATNSPTPQPTATPVGGLRLVWEDNFDVDGQPNSSNWNYHVGNGYNPGLPGFQGWGNGEWEWYRPENCYVQGGNLVIRADYSTTPYYNVGGRDWYQKSGRITTQGKRSWQYGRIEARIRLPKGQGNWCAFWAMGTSSAGGTYTSSYNPSSSYYDIMVNNWASCGEIDICEHSGASTTGFANCFWDNRIGVYPWDGTQNANYANNSAPYGDVNVYKVYALEWDATYMKWFVDSTQTHIIDITPAHLEEFHKPFYVILNMAIGGTLGGAVDAGAFPMYMYVDYVRVYQQ
ncbi:MAG: discoidin domain-containing protein [Spirochaetales bacterium]|nr:discoidin domain-containing protein [Spirochaetales bacterium]